MTRCLILAVLLAAEIQAADVVGWKEAEMSAWTNRLPRCANPRMTAEGAAEPAGISSIDCRDIPADIILDTTIHPSLVYGEKGLAAMKTLVERYFSVGGTAIHFNVFSAEELLDAQLHPEKYENLQVRVCGWNVRWNDLPKEQQDAYIQRAENVMKGW